MISYNIMKRTPLIFSLPSFLVAFVLMALMLFALVNIVPKAWSSYKSYAKLKDEKSKLLEDNKSILADVENLKNNRGIEEEVRNRFNLGKEGEEVFVVLENQDIVVATTSEQTWFGIFKKSISNLFTF